MTNKWCIIGEIFILLIGLVYVGYFLIYPEFKKSQGSSDRFINTNEYQYLIEVELIEKPHFALVINKKNQISNILFYNEESLCLYNQNIEKNNIETAIKLIIDKLQERKYLKEQEQLTLIGYGKEKPNEINSLITQLQTLQLSPIWKEEQSLQKELEKLKIEINTREETEQLRELEIYSKEIVRYKKNNINHISEEQKTTKEEIKDYTDEIYEKIQNYTKEKKITNQPKEETKLPIQLIPIGQDPILYPTSSSWYYIEDSQVYAYIELEIEKTTYGYCYKGTKKEVMEGDCK